MWGYVVGAVVAYLLLKEKIATIKRWIKRHVDLIDRWKDNPEIMAAYNNLDTAIKSANLDRRWSIPEVITILALAISLMNLIKKFEEEGEA